MECIFKSLAHFTFISVVVIPGIAILFTALATNRLLSLSTRVDVYEVVEFSKDVCTLTTKLNMKKRWKLVIELPETLDNRKLAARPVLVNGRSVLVTMAHRTNMIRNMESILFGIPVLLGLYEMHTVRVFNLTREFFNKDTIGTLTVSIAKYAVVRVWVYEESKLDAVAFYVNKYGGKSVIITFIILNSLILSSYLLGKLVRYIFSRSVNAIEKHVDYDA